MKIVRSSTRRKFLVALLGSGMILGLGSASVMQLVKNLQVSFNTRGYPDDNDNLVPDSFSPDLNLMAMINVGRGNHPDEGLYIWNYLQQRMVVLPAGPQGGASIWSPDSRYVLYPAQYSDGSYALDLWDVPTRHKICSYTGNYASPYESLWAPDGSRIALLMQGQTNLFVIMDSEHLLPLFTFEAPDSTQLFIWSPDSRRLAVLVAASASSTWSIQIWDTQTRAMDTETVFQGPDNQFANYLAWSPDGMYIAALARGQLQILHIAERITTYALDEPNDYGILAWSPGSRYLAVISDDNEVTLSLGSRFDVWDIVERRVVRSFNRGSSGVPDGLVWSKDGKDIIVIGNLYRQENWNWS